MNPAELDWLLNGDFIYRRADGSTYTSPDYKLRDMGVECVGRTGPIRAASAIEAASADETRSGSAEGESAVGEAETPK